MSDKYTLKVFGMYIKGKSPWIYVLLPVFLGIAYLASAISLYAFHSLFSIPDFSWWNVLLWMIVLATCAGVFRKD